MSRARWAARGGIFLALAALAGRHRLGLDHAGDLEIDALAVVIGLFQGVQALALAVRAPGAARGPPSSSASTTRWAASRP
ncbi:MAG: hypothetical protein U5K43_06500 [Halofilum sp. (in: g-proteobacteria)]|nr:hypothetical protein [Halofilum sp. (in: g-proteobacteria)]